MAKGNSRFDGLAIVIDDVVFPDQCALLVRNPIVLCIRPCIDLASASAEHLEHGGRKQEATLKKMNNTAEADHTLVPQTYES